MDKASKKKTIYDLAQLTGASPSTVSAVMNGTWRQRRIKEATALEIKRLAQLHGYTTNRQASGLRKASSGLIGLIVPAHFNRFFSSMSQVFEAHARARGLCPVVVSTLRDPEEERKTVEILISYAVEHLFIVGATDPDALSDLCAAANLKCINIDLPGSKAPSVVSDNYGGAVELTKALLDYDSRSHNGSCETPYFVGGANWDYATIERISGFRDTVQAHFGTLPDGHIMSNSYEPDASRRDLEIIYQRNGRLPRTLFVNSTFAFEGVLKFFSTLPITEFDDMVIGCYDYDPFASFMHVPVLMMRQDVERLIGEAFSLIDADIREPILIKIKPELIMPRTVFTSPLETLAKRPSFDEISRASAILTNEP